MNIPLILFLLVLAAVSYAFWQKARRDQETGRDNSGEIKQAGEDDEDIFNEEPDSDLLLENVRVGGVLTLMGMGDEYEDVDAIVQARHIYREDEDYWYELELDCGGTTLWLEVPNEISGALNLSSEKLSLQDLDCSMAELRSMEGEGEGELTWEDREYYYDDSGEAEYFENGVRTSGKRFYYWYFLSDDEKAFISVNHWGRGRCDVFSGQVVQANDITVFALKKA